MADTLIHDDFLLETAAARWLYHEVAEGLPIIDYHCHLPPQEIAVDCRFTDLAETWLEGDHYKWRALRANGVEERLFAGSPEEAWEAASDLSAELHIVYKERPLHTVLSCAPPMSDCRAVNLGYRDPAFIRPVDFINRATEEVLYVPKAGERLFHLRNRPAWASGK